MSVNPRTPAGRALEKGYQCAITMAGAPDIELYEREVQPFGMDVGEKIDITTQHNQDIRTFAIPALPEVTDGQTVCGYDPAILVKILARVGKNDKLTYHFPNGDTWVVDGGLKSFVPNAMSQTAMPEATAMFIHTGVDSSVSEGDELKPVYTPSA